MFKERDGVLLFVFILSVILPALATMSKLGNVLFDLGAI